MSVMTPQTEARLRQGFKYFNRLMLLMWRLGLGSWINIWPEVFGQILVITHKGRKSGLRRRTPVNFAVVDGEIYCTAGFGDVSDWYRNIMSNPRVEVWMPDGWWEGLTEDVSAHPQRIALMRQVLIGAGFAAPLFGVDPRRLSDADLQAVTANYCLVHIRRTAPRTGRDGPGDLAWIWPLATFILLPLVVKKKKS